MTSLKTTVIAIDGPAASGKTSVGKIIAEKLNFNFLDTGIMYRAITYAALDSNVVYFEHLKEDIRNGRTLRSAVDQAFPVAFKTIFWANLASLIGAAILYWLTVGSVRGFALMLGLASILDLLATYFFLRPFVKFLGMQNALQSRPWLSGLPTEETAEQK